MNIFTLFFFFFLSHLPLNNITVHSRNKGITYYYPLEISSFHHISPHYVFRADYWWRGRVDIKFMSARVRRKGIRALGPCLHKLLSARLLRWRSSKEIAILRELAENLPPRELKINCRNPILWMFFFFFLF